MIRKSRKSSWQATWNNAGARVALAAASLAAGSTLAAPPMSDFKSMDANGDGRVSFAEHTAAVKRMFDAMDANHDGKVTAAEMDGAFEKVNGRKPAAGDKSAAEKIKAGDANGDGVLTAGEHETLAKRMFQSMDKNGDGYLSPAEFEAGHAALKPKK